MIKDLKHQIEQLTVKLEKAFSVKEELELSSSEEPEQPARKKVKRKVRV
jgi:hypothetical protein